MTDGMLGRQRRQPTIDFAIAIFAAVCALVSAASCKGQKLADPVHSAKGQLGGAGQAGRKSPQAFAVETQTVRNRQLEFAIDALGTVVAFEEAQVTARVAGTVDKVDFAEGDLITTDQVLAEVEPRRFRLVAEQARATIQRTQAMLDDAKKTLARKKQMGIEVATGEEIDLAGAKVRIAQAELAQGQATLELAELNLGDARVRSAVAGVVQSRKVQTGQYVQPGTVLATVLRLEPLRVQFAVAEIDAQRLQPAMPVEFRLRGLAATQHAMIKHIAGKADDATRLVQVWAEIGGDHAGMRPGAFAEVRMTVGNPWPAPVVPQSAIRPSDKGFIAYVIEAGGPPKARERILQLGMRTADGLIEVKAGLVAGEQVVIVGAEALREGAQVRVVVGPTDGKGDQATVALGSMGLPTSPTPTANTRRLVEPPAVH
ncbi:MAG: efflux RND transporter periplasmic adaptor subunit [Myxococcales bacterium]|nr:efflux RND transporter periplasmic adaptor subunit [Myxococcales bacterium]